MPTIGGSQRHWPRLLPLFWMLATPVLPAQDLDWGGSIRSYLFLREKLAPTARRDSELGIFRLTSNLELTRRVRVESHAILNFLSPPLSTSADLADSSANLYLPMEHHLMNRPEGRLLAAFDRLNLELEFDPLNVIVGRQALTWGVSYFWPALDLFAPFAPQRLDRDYKPGIDAVRGVLRLGQFSELEVVAASLGPDPGEDAAAGFQLRLNAGAVDVGLMAGSFHGDDVAGIFLTSDVAGTGLRGEVSWTRSGDAADAERNRETFWRGSVGVDQQLTPYLTLILEGAYNGYGTGSPGDYPLYFDSDRISRGEVNGTGRLYGGVSLAMLLHPLLTFSTTALVNGSDRSLLWLPSLTWSTGNDSEFLVGSQFGFGSNPGVDGQPGTEYGAVPRTFFVGFKQYF